MTDANNNNPSDEFGAEEPNSLDLERIIATHIALNPERRAWRHDIVVSTAVELLVGADRTTDELLVAVNRTLKTRTVLAAEFERVLADAEAAGLIVQPTALSGVARWQLTRTAREEAAEDRAWGQRVYADFERGVARTLTDEGLEMPAARAERAARHLLKALSAGAGNYAVTAGLEGLLRPIEFDRPAVQRVLATVGPRALRHAVVGAAEAAMDPDEPFANDLVHLLVVSNLLHGFATRRDLPAAARLDGVRVLLDTSVLFDLIADGTPEKGLVLEMLELCERSGIEVVVADHTLDEWDRVWVAANSENPQRHEAEELDPLIGRLTKNPFITEFLGRRKGAASMTWGRFETQVRDLRRLLEMLPSTVRIRPAGNHTESDRHVVAAAREKIKALSTDPTVPGRRTGRAGDVDAEAVAMIRRWRTNGPASGRCCAYFVANDYLTNRAYRELFADDRHPLSVNVAGFTSYVAASITDDPGELAALADVMGSALVRESMFSVATSYTLDEAVTLSKLLAEDSGQGIDVADARAAMQLDFDALMAEVGERPVDMINAAARELLRVRSRRRDERAARVRATADRELREAGETIAQLNERLAAGSAAAGAHATPATSAPTVPPPAAPMASETVDPWQTRVAAVLVGIGFLTATIGFAYLADKAASHMTSRTSTFTSWSVGKALAGGAGVTVAMLAGWAVWHGAINGRADYIRRTFTHGLVAAAGTGFVAALLFVFGLN